MNASTFGFPQRPHFILFYFFHPHFRPLSAVWTILLIKTETYSSVQIGHISYLPVRGLLGYSQLLTITDKIAVGIHIQIFE